MIFYRMKAGIAMAFSLKLVVTLALQAQTPPKVVPPSPNAAAFAKYGDIPVSYYTGVPNISIPLYTIKAGTIEVPISLSYHASGIKVSDEASRVGLGWVLNAGGLLSRTIANKDDFYASSFAYLSPTNSSPTIPDGPAYVPDTAFLQAGTIYKLRNGASSAPIDFTNYSYLNGEYDFQPDQFNYNFLGKSGKFVLTRDRLPVFEKNEKLRAEPSTNGGSWVFTDASGTVFTFAAHETVNMNDGTGDHFSSWYLTKIKSVNGDSIVFNYTSLPQQFIFPVGEYQEGEARYRSSCNSFKCTPVGDTLRWPLPRKFYSNIYLSSIVWNNGKAEFEVEGRDDIENDIRIKHINFSSLDAQNAVTLREQIKFNYSYFDYDVLSNVFLLTGISTDQLRKRLKLISVSRSAASTPAGQEEVHQFQYFESEYLRLPPKNSFARDHWGYYNRKNENTSLLPSYKTVNTPETIADLTGVLGEERNAVESSMHAFTLRQIIYPTKGTTDFVFEAHQFEIVPSDGEPEQVPVTKPFFFDAQTNRGIVASQVFNLTDEFSGSNINKVIPIRIKGVFRGSAPTAISTANIYFEIVNSSNAVMHRVSMYTERCSGTNNEYCIMANTDNLSMQVFSYEGYATIPPGIYHWRAFVEGSETRFQDISVQYTYYADIQKRSPLGENYKYAVAGGLRIKQIESQSSESNSVPVIKRFIYGYEADTDGNGTSEFHSYGKRMRSPVYSLFDVSWERKWDADTQKFIGCLDCYHFLKSSQSNLPIAGSNGSTVTYDKVYELHGQNGENGKVEYNFINIPEESIPSQYPYRPSYKLRPAFNSTRRQTLNGEMTSKIIYNALGTPVFSVSNNYEEVLKRVHYALEVRRIPTIGFDIPQQSAILLSLYPAIESSFPWRSITIERYFDSLGDTTLTKTTQVFYSNLHHLQPTQETTTFSDGQKTITRYRYPADYVDADAGSVVMDMKGTAHMHDKPIETMTLDEQSGVRTILDHVINVYDSFTGKIMLRETAKYLNTSPVAETGFPIYKPVNGYSATNYFKVFSLDYYTNGNIKKIQKNFDVPKSYLWGYKDSYPIAEITNASAEQCFYNSFEDTGSAFVDGSGNNLAKSGEKVLSAVTYSFPGSFTPVAANTVMSYWYYQNSKWNYSGEVPYAATISTSGTKIDEVRAYPKGSKMTTYNYDPFRGITQILDSNGKHLRYEYDAFGRLKLEKDNDDYIMKAYEFNYKISN